MKTIANIIWIILAGLWMFIAYSIIGILLCITIIGIPFGVQCFKIAIYALAPFGKNVKTKFEKHPIANILWFLIFGWEGAITAFIVGLILCITIIGIPLGKKCFDFGTLLLFPFGAEF